jgi:hypothetical protein
MGDPVARSGQAAGQQLPHPVGGHGQHPRLVCGREPLGRDRHRGDQFLLGGREAEPGQAVGERGRGDRVGVGAEPHRQPLVAQPPHRLGGASHDLAAHVQRAVQFQQHGVDAGQRRPTTHLRHVRLDHPGKASRCAAAASSTTRTRKAGQRS